MDILTHLPHVLAARVYWFLSPMSPPYLNELKTELKVCRLCEFAFHVKSCSYVQFLSSERPGDACSACLNTKHRLLRRLYGVAPRFNTSRSLVNPEWFTFSMRPFLLPGSRRARDFTAELVASVYGYDYSAWPLSILVQFPLLARMSSEHSHLWHYHDGVGLSPRALQTWMDKIPPGQYSMEERREAEHVETRRKLAHASDPWENNF